MEHMGLVLYPAMKEVFQGQDGERWAEFKCQTCHGDDAKEVNYEMPNAIVHMGFVRHFRTSQRTRHDVNVRGTKQAGEKINCLSCHLKE